MQLRNITWLALALLLWRCAQITPLTGGARDSKPPQVLRVTPANGALNYMGGSILFEFDELVQVTDLSNQLIITPGFTQTPEVVAEGKNIRVTFDRKELRPNTTYHFRLGSAIADMHETNKMSGLDHVFSTGPDIDTLKISGRVKDAFNNQSIPDVVVGLYEGAQEDSTPYRQPDYITRSGSDGTFTLTYLPARSFHMFAFIDKNHSNTYDGESEKIAFMDSPVKAGSDSIAPLNLFQETAPHLFLKKKTMPYYGLTLLQMNRPGKYRISALKQQDAKNISIPSIGGDTARVYYRQLKDTLALIWKNEEEGIADTVIMALPSKPTKKSSRPVKTNIVGGKLPYKQLLQFNFLFWMDTMKVQGKAIHIRKEGDSLDLQYKLMWSTISQAQVSADFKPATKYVVKVDTSAFTDAFGRKQDSLETKFVLQDKTDFGQVVVRLSTDNKEPLLVQLINENQQVVMEKRLQFSMSSSTNVVLNFDDVVPGIYNLKVVYDVNNNGKWDTGDWKKRSMPERVRCFSKQIKVVADWEVEEEFVSGKSSER